MEGCPGNMALLNVYVALGYFSIHRKVWAFTLK
jgi:hypothetical protein